MRWGREGEYSGVHSCFVSLLVHFPFSYEGGREYWCKQLFCEPTHSPSFLSFFDEGGREYWCTQLFCEPTHSPSLFWWGKESILVCTVILWAYSLTFSFLMREGEYIGVHSYFVYVHSFSCPSFAYWWYCLLLTALKQNRRSILTDVSMHFRLFVFDWSVLAVASVPFKVIIKFVHLSMTSCVNVVVLVNSESLVDCPFTCGVSKHG